MRSITLDLYLFIIFIKNHLPFYSSSICKQLYRDTGIVHPHTHWKRMNILEKQLLHLQQSPSAFIQGCASDRHHTAWFSVCCDVLGVFLAALYALSATARAEPAPPHGSCLRNPRNSCLLACFPGGNQETLPLWREQNFLPVGIFRIPLNPSQGISGCLGKAKPKFTFAGPGHWSNKMFWLVCKEIITAFSRPSYDLQVNLPASGTAAALDIFFIKKIKSKGSYRLCMSSENNPPKKEETTLTQLTACISQV